MPWPMHRYDVEILEGEMPSSAVPSALFIDIVGHPLTPLSVAGVARRTRRRTARRVARRHQRFQSQVGIGGSSSGSGLLAQVRTPGFM